MLARRRAENPKIVDGKFSAEATPHRSMSRTRASIDTAPGHISS
jgi:hypothetical protein